jgi:hypothetical protein
MKYPIPKDTYKKVEIDKNISVTGFRSTTYDFQDKLIPDLIQLTIQTDTHDASFKFNIRGRDKILELKEVIEFALEIDEERERIRRENNKKVNEEIRDRAIERDKKANRKNGDSNVPRNLEECLSLFEDFFTPEGIKEIKKMDERDMCVLHHEIGRWLRNNWGLWRTESNLCKWFQEQGVFHPDDMSDIILKSFWRKMNDKSIKLDEQIQCCKIYWEKRNKSDDKTFGH